MVTVTEQHRARSARGEDRRFTPPLRPSAASVVDSVVPLCRCGKNQFLFVDSWSLFVERIADALGRPLGEFQSGTFPGEASTIQTQHTLSYNATTGQVISDTNAITTSGTAPEGTDPARYVYAPNGTLLLREMGTFGATTPNQYIYALTDPAGTVIAIASAAGTVDERYVFDGLGNAQALQANGTPYGVATFSNPSRSANWQFQQQFSGSTFNTGTQLLTYAGTDYAWNIVYQGQMYDGIPGIYETANGAFNPREQALLAPNLGAIQQGISAYDPTAGETGFNGWYDRNAGTIAAVSGVGLSLAATFLTGGLAAPLLTSAIGFAGTAASGVLGVASDAIAGAISTAGDIAGASEEAISSASDAVSSWVNDTADSISQWSQDAGSSLAKNALIAKAVGGGASGFASSLSGAMAHHDGFWETATNTVIGTVTGGFLGYSGGFLSNLTEEAAIGWRLGATVGLGMVGGGVSGAAIQGIDARAFGDKFTWSDVGVSAISGGLVSVPFGGADLAIDNANTPWLNLVGAGLAPVEGYAHTLTEQGIDWLSRQTPGS